MKEVKQTGENLLILELGSRKQISLNNVIASKLFSHEKVKLLRISNKEFVKEEKES